MNVQNRDDQRRVVSVWWKKGRNNSYTFHSNIRPLDRPYRSSEPINAEIRFCGVGEYPTCSTQRGNSNHHSFEVNERHKSDHIKWEWPSDLSPGGMQQEYLRDYKTEMTQNLEQIQSGKVSLAQMNRERSKVIRDLIGLDQHLRGEYRDDCIEHRLHEIYSPPSVVDDVDDYSRCLKLENFKEFEAEHFATSQSLSQEHCTQNPGNSIQREIISLQRTLKQIRNEIQRIHNVTDDRTHRSSENSNQKLSVLGVEDINDIPRNQSPKEERFEDIQSISSGESLMLNFALKQHDDKESHFANPQEEIVTDNLQDEISSLGEILQIVTDQLSAMQKDHSLDPQPEQHRVRRKSKGTKFKERIKSFFKKHTHLMDDEIESIVETR